MVLSILCMCFFYRLLWYVHIVIVIFILILLFVRTVILLLFTCTWTASWQNQQCGCAPSEDSDQPVHPPSLIRVFGVRMKKDWVFSYPLSAQRRLWSDWADAQADLNLRWAHSHIVGFVTRRLTCVCRSKSRWKGNGQEPLQLPARHSSAVSIDKYRKFPKYSDTQKKLL